VIILLNKLRKKNYIGIKNACCLITYSKRKSYRRVHGIERMFESISAASFVRTSFYPNENQVEINNLMCFPEYSFHHFNLIKSLMKESQTF